MSTASVAVSFELAPRGNIREAVAGRILAAVIRGELPAGQRMIVQRLAEKFHVSATPVREALVELAAIGIVENLPNRGAVLREFGPAQIREIYQIRRILETEAIRSACGRMDVKELHEIEREFELLEKAPRDGRWSVRAMEIDVRLHALVAANCGSRRLRDEIERYNTLVQVVREVVDNERQAQEIALSEHCEILQALLAEDVESATDAMAQHIRSTATVVEEAMFSSASDAPVER